jgi:drug/metabolite transporter (DMT)-like permease
MLNSPLRARILVAFFAVYIVWGSTYLGVRYALISFPPFILSGTRYFFAGMILLFLSIVVQKASLPTMKQFRNAAIIGFLLITTGNGLMTWGLQRVPSGMAALIGATGPMMLVLIQWGWGKASRPKAVVWFALTLGIIGMLFLVDENSLAHTKTVRLIDVGVILLACISWNFGTIFSTDADLPKEPLLMTGIEMFFGGTLQYIWAGFMGEWSTFELASVTPMVWFAMFYLVVIGTLWGFTSYIWLVRTVPPVMVSTHTFINPIVAIFLGVLILKEAFTTEMAIASILMIGAVVILTFKRNTISDADQVGEIG